MLVIVLPAALAGSYALLAVIVRLLGGQRRPERDAQRHGGPDANQIP
jgi:hypothetical protein